MLYIVNRFIKYYLFGRKDCYKLILWLVFDALGGEIICFFDHLNIPHRVLIYQVLAFEVSVELTQKQIVLFFTQ